jgi:putative heme transporter
MGRLADPIAGGREEPHLSVSVIRLGEPPSVADKLPTPSTSRSGSREGAGQPNAFPALEPPARPTGRRRPVVRGVVAFVVSAGAIAWVAHGGLLSEGLRALGHGSSLLLSAAFLVALTGLSVAALAQRRLLAAVGVSVSRVTVVRVGLSAHAMAATLPAGNALASTWSFRQWRSRGASHSEAGGVVVVAGALSWLAALVLGCTVAMTTLGPVVVAPLIVVALGVLVAAKGRGGERAVAGLLRTCRRLVGRPRADPAVLAAEVSATVRKLRLGRRDGLIVVAMMVLSRACDCGALGLAVAATGGRVSWPALVAAWGVAKVLGVVPLAPGGLGIVDGGMVGVLVASGATPASAVAGVLGYRLATLWLPAVCGWAAHAGPPLNRWRRQTLA